MLDRQQIQPLAHAASLTSDVPQKISDKHGRIFSVVLVSQRDCLPPTQVDLAIVQPRDPDEAECVVGVHLTDGIRITRKRTEDENTGAIAHDCSFISIVAWRAHN